MGERSTLLIICAESDSMICAERHGIEPGMAGPRDRSLDDIKPGVERQRHLCAMAQLALL